ELNRAGLGRPDRAFVAGRRWQHANVVGAPLAQAYDGVVDRPLVGRDVGLRRGAGQHHSCPAQPTKPPACPSTSDRSVSSSDPLRVTAALRTTFPAASYRLPATHAGGAPATVTGAIAPATATGPA